jgi:hypothetical protein
MPTEESNSVALRIHAIAVERCNLSLIEEIKADICRQLGYTEKKVTRMLNNTDSLSKAESTIIAGVLSRYKQTDPEDLFKPCTSKSENKIA